MVLNTCWPKWALIVATRTGKRTTTAPRNHFSGLLFISLCGSLGFCFFALRFVNRKPFKCLSVKLNKYWESFSYYVLVVPTTWKKVFSRYNFSDNSELVLSGAFQRAVTVTYLFFVVVVDVAVLKFSLRGSRIECLQHRLRQVMIKTNMFIIISVCILFLIKLQ